MKIATLIVKNIRFYYRSWLITLAGALIGTAVLTGALITGDSVKYSLKELVAMRLGSVHYALAPSDRFFRQALAAELSSQTGSIVVSVLRTTGIVTEPNQNLVLNQAQIVGISNDFKLLWEKRANISEMVVPGEGEAVVSENLAERLKLKPGDFVVVKIPKEGFAPANAPFVSEKAETSGLRLKIKAIANERNGGRFSLGNNQSAPFNLFVSEKLLARRMGMPGFTNTLLVAGSPSLNADSLNEVLQKLMQPADAGLLFTNPEPGITQLTSGRIFIEDTLASAIRNSVPEARGVLTYLVNEISFGDHATPYSLVSATDSGIMPVDPKPGRMVINNWLADDLDVKPGDSVTLRYWVMGANRSLREATSGFRIEAVVPIANSESFRALMPDFPGMKNTGNCRDWETGTPVNLDKIRDKDETYWNDYKGTPKAWISLADGQRLWKNPFGSHTAFRFSANSGEKSLQNMIREINPAALGLSFTPVFQDGLMAAANSTDFGELFLSLGGLIVIAGLLLSGMLFALFLNHRIEEIALYRALGFKNRTILTIFFMETMLVSAIGSFAGVLAAIGYARLIVSALNTLWQDAVNTSSLFVHVDGATLLTGFLSQV
jgi:hypothetical protein